MHIATDKFLQLVIPIPHRNIIIFEVLSQTVEELIHRKTNHLDRSHREILPDAVHNIYRYPIVLLILTVILACEVTLLDKVIGSVHHGDDADIGHVYHLSNIDDPDSIT